MLSHGVSAVSTTNVNLSLFLSQSSVLYINIYKTSHNYDIIICVITNILGGGKKANQL